MCGAFTPCDSRCEGMEPHMHCHYCSFPLSCEGRWHEEIDFNGRKLPISEALWRCTNPECNKTELVTGMMREAPLGCDCSTYFAD